MKARRTSRRAFAFVAFVGFAALGACDQPKPRTPKPAPPPVFPTPQPTPSAGPPMPPLPAWSAPLLGQPVARLFPGERPPCVGNTDNVQERYGGAAPGVQIVGWGWDPGANAPVARVLLVDVDGLVAGAGQSGLPRADVPRARPEVSSPNTGWAAYTSRTVGPLDAYGIVGQGRSLCRLGHLAY